MSEDKLDVEVYIDIPIAQSARLHFDRAKKLEEKLEGLKKARVIMQNKLDSVLAMKIPEKKVKIKRERLWFEKFRWSYSRSGKLIIAGRDTQTNEMLVKKYTDSNDMYFHTNIHGSAHVVLKSGKDSNLGDFEDAGLIAAVYSKAYSEGLSSIDVYYVSPDQVTKSANSGESLGTGAFVIRGERNWLKKVSISFCLGILDLKDAGFENPTAVLGSKELMIQKKSPIFFELSYGNKEKSDICKLLQKRFKEKGFDVELDDLLSILPAGKFEFVKNK